MTLYEATGIVVSLHMLKMEFAFSTASLDTTGVTGGTVNAIKNTVGIVAWIKIGNWPIKG